MCGLEYTHLANQIKRIIHRHVIEHIPGCKLKPFVGMKKTRRSFRDILILVNLKEKCSKKDPLPLGQFKCGNCSVCSLAWTMDHLDNNQYHVKLKQFFYMLYEIYYIFLKVLLWVGACGDLLTCHLHTCVLASFSYKTGNNGSTIDALLFEKKLWWYAISCHWTNKTKICSIIMMSKRPYYKGKHNGSFALRHMPHLGNISFDLSCFV